MLVTLVLASCGDDENRPAIGAGKGTGAGTGAGTIELKVRSDTGAREAHAYRLTCRPGLRRVTGSPVKRSVVSLCGDASALAPLLMQPRQLARRMCTQVYGGPQIARITGTIDGRRVDRTFRRTNGCEIEQYARVYKILPR